MGPRIRTLLRWVALGPLLAAGAPAAFAQESPHGELKVPCEQCHTATSWKEMRNPSGFDHSSTRFPLAGQHSAVPCQSCHGSLKFGSTPRECAGCHADTHRGELGMACERCHSMNSWLVPDMLQRHSQTRFPLLGAHRSASCRDCHTNQERNEYSGLPSDCYGCHRPDFEATLSPVHTTAGFSTDCVACHRVDAITWGSGSFEHASTGFPLTGAHRALACAQCHAGNKFGKIAADCYSCHRTDFEATSAPGHVAAGFSTDCVTCHQSNATSWGGSFNHANTGFPLTGAHLAVPCLQCHVGNKFAGTLTDCYACHQQDFTSALNPPHAASGFATTCQTCHTTTAWQPSTFQHDTYFPISAGTAHSPGRWNACADCHPTAGNFQAFTCTNCHARTLMDPKHSQVQGYQYASQACYTCHPRGRN